MTTHIQVISDSGFEYYREIKNQEDLLIAKQTINALDIDELSKKGNDGSMTK